MGRGKINTLLTKEKQTNSSPPKHGWLSGPDNGMLWFSGPCTESRSRRQPPPGLSHTAVNLVTPVATVVVAVTLQFPGDTDATGAQKALAPSAEH